MKLRNNPQNIMVSERSQTKMTIYKMSEHEIQEQNADWWFAGPSKDGKGETV